MPAERIPIANLKPGMYVLNPGISWINAPLLYMREGLVADQAEIDGIIQQGFTEVIHDPERAVPTYEPAARCRACFHATLPRRKERTLPPTPM